MAGLALTITPPPIAPMGYESTLVASTSLVTGNTYTSAWYQVGAYSEIDYFIDVTLVGTTSPTFDLTVQRRMPDKTTAHDIAAIAQLSATSKRLLQLPNAPQAGLITPVTNLSAGNYLKNGEGLGFWHRLVITVTGTNVSFTTVISILAVK